MALDAAAWLLIWLDKFCNRNWVCWGWGWAGPHTICSIAHAWFSSLYTQTRTWILTFRLCTVLLGQSVRIEWPLKSVLILPGNVLVRCLLDLIWTNDMIILCGRIWEKGPLRAKCDFLAFFKCDHFKPSRAPGFRAIWSFYFTDPTLEATASQRHKMAIFKHDQHAHPTHTGSGRGRCSRMKENIHARFEVRSCYGSSNTVDAVFF